MRIDCKILSNKKKSRLIIRFCTRPAYDLIFMNERANISERTQVTSYRNLVFYWFCASSLIVVEAWYIARESYRIRRRSACQVARTAVGCALLRIAWKLDSLSARNCYFQLFLHLNVSPTLI